MLTNGGDLGGWGAFRDNGNEERTVAAHLHAAGYRTALIGKYLNGIEADPTYIPPGWSEWYGFVDNISYTGYNYQVNENGMLVRYGNAESDYATDVVARKTIDIIDRAEAADATPFFLYVSPTAPHFPLPPAPRHRHPYRSASAPRRPNYNEANISDKPSWLRVSGDAWTATVDNWNDVDYRDRMGTLYAFDELIGGIVQALQDNGEFENTILVFTSDNGYNLGAHPLIHKMAPYEESLRIPLVIAGPGIQPGVEDCVTLETDFAPTFLALAGLVVPADIDGRSLVPLLSRTPGAPSSWPGTSAATRPTASAPRYRPASLLSDSWPISPPIAPCARRITPTSSGTTARSWAASTSTSSTTSTPTRTSSATCWPRRSAARSITTWSSSSPRAWTSSPRAPAPPALDILRRKRGPRLRHRLGDQRRDSLVIRIADLGGVHEPAVRGSKDRVDERIAGVARGRDVVARQDPLVAVGRELVGARHRGVRDCGVRGRSSEDLLDRTEQVHELVIQLVFEDDCRLAVGGDRQQAVKAALRGVLNVDRHVRAR